MMSAVGAGCTRQPGGGVRVETLPHLQSPLRGRVAFEAASPLGERSCAFWPWL